MKIKYIENGIRVTFNLGDKIKIISGIPTDVWNQISFLTGIAY